MELFREIVKILAAASLGFTIVAFYLKLNKLWKHKHEPEVVGSISIMGNAVEALPNLLFVLNAVLETQ